MVHGLWPIGILIYVLGTFLGGLGANLQRKAFVDEQESNEDDGEDMTPAIQRKVFVCGLILFVCSGIFMAIALNFSSQTSLAPLLLFLLVFNALFAYLINNERIHWLGLDGLAIVIVVIGVSMALVGAPKGVVNYTISQATALIQTSGFITFFTCVPVAIVVIWLAKYYIEYNKLAQEDYSAKIFLYISYGALAGSFGGLNITLTKFLFATITGEGQHSGIKAVICAPLVWIISVFLITTYVMQILVAIEGLEHASAIIVMSAHSVVEEITASMGGIFCFGDARDFKQWQWLLFFFGNLLAIGGVIVLTHSRLKHLNEDRIIPIHESESLTSSFRSRSGISKETSNYVRMESNASPPPTI